MDTIFFKQCFRKQCLYAIFLPLCHSLLSPLHIRPFSSQKSTHPTKSKRLDKAQRVLDIISPKPNVIHNRPNHLRIIQDFLQTNSHQFTKQCVSNESAYSYPREDSISMLFRLHIEGLRIDPYLLSHALSSCGSARTLKMGIQVHCLAIRTGFIANVYVGSSLISLYCKCGELDNAHRVFEEMPVKNVVSWTTIISGFAQEWQVDVCLDLYRQMRNSTLKPNDFTFTSLLSACMGSGSLGQGRSAHCQTIQLGFVSYIHISNALISMYCKCGNVQDAFFLFRSMHRKDLVSWNSIIAGFGQHGLALQAIDIFEEMKQQRVKPDALTFLGVLSSCRHAGLVKQGHIYFNSMFKFGLKPELDHYSCIVDLLGRAGFLEDARDFIKKMPVNPNAIIWGSLLSSCRLQGNVWIGIEAAENRLVLEPWCAATHLQLANLYASAGYWDQVARVRKLMKDKRLKTDPGYSWIEIGNGVYRFGAEVCSNSKANEIIRVVDGLVDHMSSLGYVPEMHELVVGYNLHTEI